MKKDWGAGGGQSAGSRLVCVYVECTSAAGAVCRAGDAG